MEKNKKAEVYKQKIIKLADKLEKKVKINYVGSDPTRLKILFLLQENKKMCTSDLADILGLSPGAVSHQKTILERFGLIESDREGKKICCRLKNSQLAKEMLRGIK